MDTGLHNADSLRSITQPWKCKNTRLRNAKLEQILQRSPQIRHKAEKCAKTRTGPKLPTCFAEDQKENQTFFLHITQSR